MAKLIPSYVHELLRDIRELTGRQFVYEDLWCGIVPFDGNLTELQTGPPVPFADLTWREQADVLREFIHWNRYPEAAWDDGYRIRDNIAAGKPPGKWLEGTSFLDPALQVQRREEMIRETFELSREIGYAQFRAENFDRPDPALVRLNPEERETFLRQWWNAARERMYASYLEQVAGLSDEELARNREAYKEAMIAGGAANVAYQDMLREAASALPKPDKDKDIER